MNASTRRRAFTLIELLVVMTIITLLIAILMPSLQRAKRAAQLAVCASNARQLAMALLTYASDHDRQTPNVGHFAYMDQMEYSHYWAFASTTPGFQNWGLLSKGGYLHHQSDVWFCPLNELETFQNPNGPDPTHFNAVPGSKDPALLPEDEHLGWSFSRSAYARRGFPDYTGRNRYKPIPISYIGAKAILADAFSLPTYVYDTGHGDGVTVGYGDGHVRTVVFDRMDPSVAYWEGLWTYSSSSGNNSRMKTLWAMFDKK